MWFIMKSEKYNSITKFQMFSIIILIITVSYSAMYKFSHPYEYVYKAWNNSGRGAVYNVLKNLDNAIPEKEFHSLIKTLILNHSEPYVVIIASDKEFIKNNKNLIELAEMSKEFYLKLDTNIHWRGSSNTTVLDYYSSKNYLRQIND